MKYTTLFSFGLAGFLAASTAYAQYPADFTKDQADSTISLRRSQVTELEGNIAAAKVDLDRVNADIVKRLAEVNTCQEALYALLGSDRAGYNAFRERIVRAEQELGALRGMNQSSIPGDRVSNLESELRMLRGNKLVLTRDHKNRVQALSNGFVTWRRGLTPASEIYTVGTWRKDRDCLWNIAKKPQIYGDPFAWPKIWRANMDQIRNPDIIHPGMQLTVVKTEVTPEDRDVTGYRRVRR